MFKGETSGSREIKYLDFCFLTLLTAKYRFAGDNVPLYFLCSRVPPTL